MPSLLRIPRSLVVFSIAALLAGCASTSVLTEPPSQSPVCAAAETGLIVWAPWWRADQKDVAAREEAAAAGIAEFFASSGCFAHSEIRRVPALPATVAVEPSPGRPGPVTRLVGVEVRELGPVVRLLGSAALVDGGTEVVLRIVEYAAPAGTQQRQFLVRWRNGGPGVVKGVASLPGDMQSALEAALQPKAAAR